MRGIVRQTFQRSGDHRLNAGIIDRARCPRARFIAQTLQSISQKPQPPFADGDRRAATSLLCIPDAQPSTIRARSADACAVFRRFASNSSSASSADVNATIANRNLPIAYRHLRK